MIHEVDERLDFPLAPFGLNVVDDRFY